MKSNWITCFILSIIGSFANAQSSEKSGEIFTKDNQKIELYGETRQYETDFTEDIQYHDADGKFHSIKKSKVKWMRLGNSLFYSLPISTGGKGFLVELLALDKQHILAEKWDAALSEYFIYDYDAKVIEGRIRFAVPGFAQGKNKKVLDGIAGYFPDCNELSETMVANWSNKQYPTNELHYFKCKDAPEQSTLIELFDKLDLK